MGEVISPRRVKSLTGKTEAVIAEECRKELGEAPGRAKVRALGMDSTV